MLNRAWIISIRRMYSTVALLLALPLLLALHAPALGQESSLFEKIGTALTGSNANPATAEDTLPPPKPDEHIIPFSTTEASENIRVKEQDGLISLVVRDAPLREVIALVAETQKLNIVFASATDTSITASFEQLPWQRVLDSLLSTSGHTWINDNGIILVTSISESQNAPPNVGGRRTEVFELDFASAVDVDQTVKGLLSPAGNSWVIEGSSTDNRRTREIIAVVDFPGNIQQIADYICQVDQPPRQVLIEAHILQVDLDDECRNGVNFEQITGFGSNQIRFLNVGFATPVPASGINDGAAPTASFLEVDGNGLNGLLEWLQTTTDAKTLASPRVLTVSGQQSRIQIGDQLGYRITTTTQTSSLESVEFLDVGVVLTVTPRITRDGRILMRIKPEVSQGQIDSNTGLPAEETTEVETDVMLRSGQGMVIGGLIQETDSIIASKIPWLGDLPYIGLAFQKRNKTKSRSEIIVTLMPHVQPYTPIVHQRNQEQLQRTLDPLVTGPLNRYPRPYEAMLPDAIRNPRRPLLSIHAKHHPEAYNQTPSPEMLPPIEEHIDSDCQYDFVPTEPLILNSSEASSSPIQSEGP